MALHLSRKCNATVIAISRTKKFLDSLAKEDKKIITICCDLSNWNDARKAVCGALPIDYLVNNAAMGGLKGFFDVTEDYMDATYSINVKAILNVSQVVADNMKSRKVSGSIVNLSSQASQAALLEHTVYCASKGAVDMMTK